MTSLLISALMQGMIYAPMALGVFLAFRILDTPDLTIDGSFVFGMTATAIVTIAGHPILALFAGILAGGVAGLVTGFLQTKLQINPILSGILTMTGLYSVNYAVLGGQSNRYLQGSTGESAATIYKAFGVRMERLPGGKTIWTSDLTALILTTSLVVIAVMILAIFFKTRTGMAIRATGDNEEMVRSSSIDADATRIQGIVLANAMVALSGALLCEQQSYADLNCGTGMLVVGLASVIIGQMLFGKKGVTVGLISAVVGSMLYRLVLQLAYKVDMPSYLVKLLSAVIVALALVMPLLKRKNRERLSKKRRMGKAVSQEEKP